MPFYPCVPSACHRQVLSKYGKKEGRQEERKEGSKGEKEGQPSHETGPKLDREDQGTGPGTELEPKQSSRPSCHLLLCLGSGTFCFIHFGACSRGSFHTRRPVSTAN